MNCKQKKQRIPLTEDEINTEFRDKYFSLRQKTFIKGIRYAEKMHGIGVENMVMQEGMWAPVNQFGGIYFSCIAWSRKEAKEYFLKDIPQEEHKCMLERIKFVKVYVAVYERYLKKLLKDK